MYESREYIRTMHNSSMVFTPVDTAVLDLERVPWEGGSAYWASFPLANAAGWSDPSFFPISVFLGKADSGHPAALAAIGINTYMAAEYQPPISNVTDHLFAIIQSPISHGAGGWTQANIGSDPNVVGWFIYDECEQGEGACSAWATDAERLTNFQGWCDDTRAYDDGRFIFANFGNGVLNSFWATDTMDQWMGSVDGCAVDKYAYTSPQVQFIIEQTSHWPGTLADAASSSAYGWFMQQMQGFDSENPSRRPVWVFVETQMPYLGEVGRGIILYDQIAGAVWSGLTREARGIAYFQHNGFYGPPGTGAGPATDPNTGLAPNTSNYSLVDGDAGLIDAVTAINAQVASFAPILNTQSYAWLFGDTDLDTMLKVKDGYAYIFASVGIGGTAGSRTFVVPSGIGSNSIEVMDESRSLTIVNHEFTDTFAQEYSHHIYKIALAGSERPGFKTIEQAGSNVDFPTSSSSNTGTVTSTLTVPADAEIAIVGVIGYNSTAGFFSGGTVTMTKGSTQVAMTSAGTEGDTANFMCSAMWYMVLPDTGTNKTITWDWAGTGSPSDSNLVWSVTFWKGINTSAPVRETNGDQWDGAFSLPPETPTKLLAQSGDLIVAFGGGYNSLGDGTGTIDTWTNATTLVQATHQGSTEGAWATGSPTGRVYVGVLTYTNMTEPTFMAVVLKPGRLS